MKSSNPIDGVLLVDKPAGITSHDVVAAVRRWFQIRRVGHCGTLDPNATGLLILLLGRATKLSEKLMGLDKVYDGTIKLGEVTDSYDADGEIRATKPVPPLSVARLNQYADGFVGDLMQTPPMVSAVKKEGVPLYKLARKGIEVERKARLIHVYQFRFRNYRAPFGDFRVLCTKGTYVRSLAHELGERIGCGAHLHGLRRLSSGEFSVANALTVDQLKTADLSGLRHAVIPMSALVTPPISPSPAIE